MSKVEEDVINTKKVIDSCGKHILGANYDRLFFSTNENINDLFSNVDICGKNVLSVLGSGDHAFHLFEKGAKNVDLFDINKLTLYYYYLRLWCIKYMGSYYIPFDFKNKYIYELLSKVNPSTSLEKDAYVYWKLLIDRYSLDRKSLFFETDISCMDENKINDLSRICQIDSEINFYNFDISSKIDLDRKYDIIVVSNITDWLCIFQKNMEIYKDNLVRHLNSGGLIVASNINYPIIKIPERRIFEKEFDIFEYPSKVKNLCHEYPVGYIYTK